MIIEAQQYGLHPDDLDFVIENLRNGKVGIIPTDTIYAFCCSAAHKSGFETICQLKRLDPSRALMSIICRDLSQASVFFKQWDTPVYRLINKNLPGPFTFILESSNKAPSFLKNKRKTLGLRIPHHAVIKSIMSQLDEPLMVSSVMQDDDVTEYYTDAADLIHVYENQVSFIVIDDQFFQEASTVIDMTRDEPVILRQSRHELKY